MRNVPVNWTPELTNELMIWAATNLSARLIGKEMNLSKWTIYQKLNALDLDRPEIKLGNKPYVWTDEKLTILNECLQEKCNISETSRRLGFWRGAVRLKMLELGIDLKRISRRPRNSIWTLAYDERLIYLWNSGVKAGKIATEFGVSKPTIFGRAATLKLSPRHTIPKKKT